MANARRRFNTINKTCDGNVELLSQYEMAEAFDGYYGNIFATKPTLSAKCKWNYLYEDDDGNEDGLYEGFTNQEVKTAVFDLAGDQASGPHGFPMFFFQEVWDVVFSDVLAILYEFHLGILDMDKLNHAQIVLVPKVEGAESH